MSISSSMFRSYDIRGVWGEDLNSETATIISKGIGTFFRNHDLRRVFVGHDDRLSSPEIFKALTANLLSCGLDVVDLGMILNPMMYFSWYELDANACVIVTASHNPAQYNGFKISLNKTSLSGEDYQAILQICQAGNFIAGQGLKEEVNIYPAYKKKIKEDIKLAKKMKVVVDCGNGTAGIYAPEILREIGCEVVELFSEPDGSFPNHDPYPQKTENYDLLRETILKEKADLGLAYDGDGDRLGVYDEKANFIENDRLAMIFAKDICFQNPGSKIVMNVSTSLSVKEYIETCGGELILWKTGYPNIVRKMKETRAIFGGEIAGHFFFRDRYFGYDDALYATFRVLEIVSKSSYRLSQIIAELPKYFETREVRVAVPEAFDKFTLTKKIAQEIKADYPEAEILDFDGLRFSFPDGWGLVRPSNTESVIGLRAEARTKPRLEEIKAIIDQKLKANNVNFFWE
ncbi:MAG: phosphomannomutase/phosphoglucomutase [Patescibacteria group bacterium]|nr:phosphomannomutase/phosphoglucomutase [Patescibacteria group bacterium]